MNGETITYGCEQVALPGIAGKIQSLDPERPVLELAFEHLHVFDPIELHMSDHWFFLTDWLDSQTEYNLWAHYHGAKALLADLHAYANHLLNEPANDRLEINRRVNDWELVITSYIDFLPSKMPQSRVPHRILELPLATDDSVAGSDAA